MRKNRFKAKSTAIVAGLGATALLRDANRRAKARQLFFGIRDAILPSRSAPIIGPIDEDVVAHAPGHRHLPPPPLEEPSTAVESGSYTVVSHHPGHVHKG